MKINNEFFILVDVQGMGNIRYPDKLSCNLNNKLIIGKLLSLWYKLLQQLTNQSTISLCIRVYIGG